MADEGPDAVETARSNGDAVGFPSPEKTDAPEKMDVDGGERGEDAAAEPAAGDDAAEAMSVDDAAASDKENNGKENDDKNDDDAATDDDAPSDDAPSDDADPNDLVLRAMSHKEDGNASFKSSDMESAARSYRKGTNLLKKLNKANSGDEQVKQLLITLQTNLSMVCFKQKKHRMSRDVASRALEIDGNNVKALYRRAVASRAMGDVDAARADLKNALKAEPNNSSVKKELAGIKKTLDEQKKKEKARLQRAFSKKGGGSLLYSDKEEEEKKKAEEKKEKKRIEAEKKERRKKEWEDECVRRMASDPPEEPISFDDWDKQRKKKEEEEEKARKKAKKAEEDRKREERRKARKAAAANNPVKGNDSDDELTEKEMAMLRGYKKTSDGRTTSYFNREQTEHEKKLIGCIKPKKLEPHDSLPSPTASASSGGGGGPVGSVWNQSGTTWEEKDTTDWCKRTLERCLLDATAPYCSATSDDATYVAVVRKVKDLKGDASVAIAGGKKRYIYDLHASVEYEVLDDEQKCIASGTLKLPDVNSATTADEDELEVDVFAWTKAPTAGGEGEQRRHVVQDAAECRKLLVQDVRKSVLRFVEKFNANF